MILQVSQIVRFLRIEICSHTIDEEIQVTALRWIDSFFEICPEDLLSFVPRLLSHVLPAMSHEIERVRQAANQVNNSLMHFIMNLSDDTPTSESVPVAPTDRRDSNISKLPKPGVSASRETVTEPKPPPAPRTPTPAQELQNHLPKQPSSVDLDYEAAVNSLTLQFLNEHEATRIASLQWLIMLHRKAPRKV